MLAIPAAVLTGMAFAGPIAAFAATQKTPDRFSTIFRFGITPLFLFSGTFFPITHAAGRAPGAGLAHAAVPRRRADPRPVARHDRRRPGRRGDPRHLPDDAGRRRGVADDPDHRAPAGARMTALRVVPGLAFGSRRSLRLIERNLYVYKHGWMVLLSGFFEPLFYLLGIGFGLGALIGTIPGPDGQPISYQLFVAPALLASAAMNGAINESTFNFFFKLNYNKTFTAILSTPLSPGRHRPRRARLGADPRRAVRDRVPGRHARARAVRVAVGDPAAARGAARRVRLRGGRDGRHVVHEDVAGLRPDPARRPADVPVLGHVLPDRRLPARRSRLFVRLTPLYQGVDLIRSLTVGAISPVLLVHVAYLAIMGIVGLAIASRRIDQLLLK